MRVSRSPLTSLRQLPRALAAFTLAAMSAATPAQATTPDAAQIQRLVQDGQAAQALKLVDAALAKNPKDPAMRFRRGVALAMLDRKPEAVQVFRQLVQDHPELPAPYNNLAVLYGAQGDYDEARNALVAAIRTNPQVATAYQNLGDVYAQLASQAYSKALQLDDKGGATPPKLVLLRELGLPAPAPAPVPAPPTQVAVAAPAPAPRPASVPMSAPPVPPKASVPAPPPAPAPKPAPVPAPPPKPAAPAPAPAANGKAVAEVDAAVHAWAAAWSRRDMAAYLGAYTPDFAAGGKSHKAWEEDRKARILPRKRIAVQVSDLRVSVNGDKAQAHFRQAYASDTLNTTGRKTLELVRSPAGKWLIRQEAVGG